MTVGFQHLVVFCALEARRPKESAEIALELGLCVAEVREILDELAGLDLVDAQDPPPPCGREHLGWYRRERMAA